MANLCEKLINTCISASCENPIFSGIDSLAYIFNKSEIDSYTIDNDNPNIVSAITMKQDDNNTDFTGYVIQQLGKTPFTGSTTSLVENDIQNKWTENVQFMVPDNSPAAAAILDNLGNGKFVVVLKNEYNGSDSKGQFQIFGLKKGLVCTAMERDPYGDSDGAWSVTLTSENVPNSAMFVYHETTPGTDDTESYLNGLVDDCSTEVVPDDDNGEE